VKIRVAAACVPDIKGDKERNFSAAADLTKRLALEGADMVVLPEACLQGYPAGAERFSRSEIVEMGEPFEGTYAQGFRDLAREASVYLVAGYDRRAGEILYNSAELIAPNGKTIGLYDKTHVMVGGDLGLYTPGASLSAFETGFGKVGLLICNDRVYSECWRVLLLQGAQIVLIPSNGGYSQMNTNRLQVMALDNCLCCAFAHPKRALIIAPSGEIVDQDKDEAKPFALAELDLSDVEERQANLLKRRRVDLYGPVTQR